MKRDMELVRSLLIEIEEKHDGSGRVVDIVADGSARPEVVEHLFMLAEAGFIEAVNASSLSSRNIMVRRLTWHGHEFLDSIRDPEIWKKTKEGALSAGGFTVELLGDLAKGFIKQQIKSKTGIEL